MMANGPRWAVTALCWAGLSPWLISFLVPFLTVGEFTEVMLWSRNRTVTAATIRNFPLLWGARGLWCHGLLDLALLQGEPSRDPHPVRVDCLLYLSYDPGLTSVDPGDLYRIHSEAQGTRNLTPDFFHRGGILGCDERHFLA